MSEVNIGWKRLDTFLKVASAGSFTRAGKQLGITQSAVSRQISLLEEELGTSLFQRTCRGLLLTEPGEDFHRTVQEMSNRLLLGLARINERQRKPVGPLRITTSIAFGSAWLSSRMNRFHRKYPDISASLVLSGSLTSELCANQVDCAIVFSRPSRLSFVQRYLMSMRYDLFASRAYLAEKGVPRSIDDLADHELVVYGDEGVIPDNDLNWLLGLGMPAGEKRTAALQINSLYAIYRAVESGLGIAALPRYLSERSEELVTILPDIVGPKIDIYFVYPEELRNSRRIRALSDFLAAEARRYSKEIGGGRMSCCCSGSPRS